MNRRIYYLGEITGEYVDKRTFRVNSSSFDKLVRLGCTFSGEIKYSFAHSGSVRHRF